VREAEHDRRMSLRPKLFKLGEYRNEGHNTGNLPLVQALVRMVSVVQKLSMIHLQDLRKDRPDCYLYSCERNG
jgi:hypothetical protein